MTPDDLSDAVLAAIRAAVDGGDLTMPVPESVRIERPKVKEHGDYATSIALQLAKPAGRPPREVAEAIAEQLAAAPGVARVDVAGPGFLNITLDSAAQGELARTVVTAGESYGRTTTMAGHRFNLEFISANPTGPLHLGHVRWAAVGDALARVLEASGADVTREYYFNDAGVQIDRYAQSLFAAAKGEPTPEGGYGGAYIGEIAKEVVARHPDVLEPRRRAALAIFRVDGLDLMFEEIRKSLNDFGVTFDVYFNEKELHDKGELDAALKRLTAAGHVFSAGRRDLAAHNDVRRRQGPRPRQERRRLDLLRRRLRLLPRQARAWFRPRRDHARCGPPWIRGSLQGARRGLR